MARGNEMRDAEDAVEWAKAPSGCDPKRTNYDRLLDDALQALAEGPGDAPIVLSLGGLHMAHWACLSRLLVMDEPELSDRIHPRYSEALDSQAGTAWMQLQFAAVTGRRPAVRSWRHAREALGL